MFLYIPDLLKDLFEPFIENVLGAILLSITEQNEKIRKMALHVLEIFIKNYGNKKMDLLLPPFQKGLASSNWLERNSSIILLGNMFEIILGNDKHGILKIPNIKDTLIFLYILRFDMNESIQLQATNV
jgi:hypothetical protein